MSIHSRATTCSAAIIALLASASASAQSFNIDFCNHYGWTQSGFAGALGQAGVWNQMAWFGGSVVDTSGSSTSVTVSTSAGQHPCVGIDDPATSGAAQSLMDDGAHIGEIGPSVHTVTISGLCGGTYEVGTYAWRPNFAPATVEVEVVGAGMQTVGGAWPGGFQQGVTHALHTLAVANGGQIVIELKVTASTPSWDGVLNGLQARRVEGPCGVIYQAYCGPAPANSTGLPAVISAAGSPFVIENNVALEASALPPNQFGYFLASRTRGFIANPAGSQGNLCLGGQILRFARAGEVQFSGSAGEFSLALDLTDFPSSPPLAVAPGEEWNFQGWFRDQDPGPTSNFTQGITIVFE
ncbi:MAG: hypothetical protein GY711_06810 [bacterium]|nr:hypothetical protein [bacterium]